MDVRTCRHFRNTKDLTDFVEGQAFLVAQRDRHPLFGAKPADGRFEGLSERATLDRIRVGRGRKIGDAGALAARRRARIDGDVHGFDAA